MRRIPRFALLLLLITFPVLRLTAATPDRPIRQRPQSKRPRAHPIGVGVKVSTLGIGGELPIAVFIAPMCASGSTLSVMATPLSKTRDLQRQSGPASAQATTICSC